MLGEREVGALSTEEQQSRWLPFPVLDTSRDRWGELAFREAAPIHSKEQNLATAQASTLLCTGSFQEEI